MTCVKNYQITSKSLIYNQENQVYSHPELARQSRDISISGGKSGLHRAGCQLTAGGREPTESAAENKPPKVLFGENGKVEMVR